MLHEAELFVMSETVLVEVVGRVRGGHWDIVLPSLFDIPGVDEPPTVRQAVDRYALEEAWVPDLLAGRRMEEVGLDRFGGDLIGDDAHGQVKRLSAVSCAAAAAATNGNAIVHAPYGDVTTRDYLWRLTFARTFTAHDIAFGLGTTACPLTEEFARAALAAVEPEAWRWRSLGIFREPLPLPECHVSWRDQFLRLAGRDPHPGHH